MTPDDFEARIGRTVQAGAAVTPAPPGFGGILDRITIRRRRRIVATSIAAAAIVIAGSAAWVASGDSSSAPRVHVPPADSTGSPHRGRCGTPITAPTEEIDLAVAHWRDLPAAPDGGRVDATYVWTGREVIEFGGEYVQPGASDGVLTASGQAYAPATRTWRAIAEAPFTPREALAATWTGSEMVVVSGDANVPGNGFNLAAAYDPAHDTWRTLPDAPVGDVDPTAVWTGTEVVLWGTPDGGAAYNPCTNRWRVTAPMPEGGPLTAVYGTASVWTGAEMVVWGGSMSTNFPRAEAAAYEPKTDRWRVLPASIASPVLYTPDPVWTGHEMFAWGWSNLGAREGRADDTVSFDPVRNVWRQAPDAPIVASAPCDCATVPHLVWTGSHVLAWAGNLDADGPIALSYDPTTDAWTTLPRPAVSAPQRSRASGFVWAGDRLLVFTGTTALELAAE
jgi:hypothetical protein